MIPNNRRWEPTAQERAAAQAAQRFPGKAIRPGDRVMGEAEVTARFAAGMSQAEVDAQLKRNVSLCRWAVILLIATCGIWAGAIWMITSGATVQQLMGFVASHITAQAPKPHPPMPRVIY